MVAAKSAKPAAGPKAKPKPALLPASEASDPAVHQVLAEYQTAVSNGDEKAAAGLVARLGKMGYSL